MFVTRLKSLLLKLDWILVIIIGIGLSLFAGRELSREVVLVLIGLPTLSIIMQAIPAKPELSSLFKKFDQKNLLVGFGPLFHLTIAAFAMGFEVYPRYEIDNYLSLFIPNGIALGVILTLIASTHKIKKGSEGSDALTLLGVIPFAFLFSFTACFTINCVFDNSAGEKHLVKVVKVSQAGRGGDQNYYANVTPWGSHKEPISVEIPSNKYHSLESGNKVTLILKPGFFRIPYYFIE